MGVTKLTKEAEAETEAGESCSDVGRVFIVNDPAARLFLHPTSYGVCDTLTKVRRCGSNR